MGKRVAKNSNRFWIGAGIYAAVALVVIGIGLFLFWSFLTAYEASRPRNTVDSYMETLTPQHILDLAGEALLDQVDGRLLNEEACKAQILSALEGRFTYARNISRSTEDTQVYVLRLGRQVVGSFWMEQTGQSAWNFTPWEVTGEEFDLSYLLGEPVTVTAPEEYTVFVNGMPLPRECVVEEIPYDEFAEIADSYDLPVMVRYKAGPLLGEITISVTDGGGEPADVEFDPWEVLDNCSDEERTLLEKTIRPFVEAYVDYTSHTTVNLYTSLATLKRLMIPKGELAQRMEAARSSLEWIPASQTASITDLEINLISRLDEGLYFCDVTFNVYARNPYGNVHTVTQAKIVFRQTDSGLLAESMIIL